MYCICIASLLLRYIFQICFISFTLFDSFGDGWGGSNLLVSTSAGEQALLEPKCGERKSFRDFCIDSSLYSDGDLIMVKTVGFEDDPSVAVSEQESIKAIINTFKNIIFLLNLLIFC